MRRLLDGDIALDDPDVGAHLDRCLGCRACETACPSGVPYGELLEATRATMMPVRGLPLVARIVLGVFARESFLRPVLFAARVLRATQIPRALARILPSRLAFPFAMLASSSPHLRNALGRNALGRNERPRSRPRVRASEQRNSVALLYGCVMDGLFGHVNAATARVLLINGYDVIAAPRQKCCGALHAHAGDLDSARALARANIAAFELSKVQYIAINSAGCGAMIKQYAHLLRDDPAWASRAEQIAARARDISELLAAVGPTQGGALPLRVTHDPPCHQMHAQRVVKQPLAVLAAIPELTLIPLEDADQCCGSAGIYNLIEPDTSDAVLAPKLRCIAQTNAAYVASGNPGCMMQLGAGLLRSGSTTRVVHPVELLDASYAMQHRDT